MKKTEIRQIGMIGLGKMGLALALNMLDKGFDVIGFDTNAEQRDTASRQGIDVEKSLEDVCHAFEKRKCLWLMVPAGPVVDSVIKALLPLLSKGDVIIDGGNSNFNDSVRRYHELEDQSIHFLDCGTSGGVDGARNGACLMVGGEQHIYEQCKSIFQSIATTDGEIYTGKPGSGHFVKMVHNGIEYAMMQAIAEGFDLLRNGPFDIDPETAARVWSNGSVIRSWLIELCEEVYKTNPDLQGIKGIVSASGEGQWTVETALEHGVATPTIALSLMQRYQSKDSDLYANRLLAALRNQFGGHAVVRE